MTEWLLGTLLALILIIKVLDYFDILDVVELLSAILKLTGALFFGIASLIVWASRKLLRKTGGRTGAS